MRPAGGWTMIRPPMSQPPLLERIDAAILDRGFQPIADRLPERLPAFELGMSMQLGAIVLDVAADVALGLLGMLSFERAAFDALSWTIGLLFYRYFRQQRGLVRPGHANPLRHGFFAMRLLAIAFCVVSAMQSIGLHGQLLLPQLFNSTANLVFTAGIYLMSCTPRPPSVARARARAEGRPATVWSR